MKQKIVVIIQARMGSTRLPGKVIMELCGKPVLWHVIGRVKQAKLVDKIVVATSNLDEDIIIADYVQSLGVYCFRGDESDVLSRYYHAAKQYEADSIVRITADCPLIDPYIMDELITHYLNNSCEYASNIGDNRTYPRGLDCEIFTFSLLERAFQEATQPYEHEHVTPFMYWKQDKILHIENEKDYSDMRWTLDTIEDYQLIQSVYNHFYKGKHDFYMQDIYAYLKSNSNIYKLNQEVKQKQVK